MTTPLFNIKNRFYGDSSIVNIVISRVLFWAIEHRRCQLQRRYREYDPVTATNDNGQLQYDLEQFLLQGIDKLNIGGGHRNLKGFLNIDFVKNKGVERELVADVLDLSFVPDVTISHIHSSHFIEHITHKQLLDQLCVYHRVLKPGGRVSIRCPNVLGVCYGFFFGQYPETGEEEFLSFGYPEDEAFYNSLDGWYYKDLYGLYHWIWALTGNKLNQHLNQLTPTKLYSALEESGFIIRCRTVPEASNLVVVAEKIN